MDHGERPAGPIKLLMVSNFFDTHRGGLEIVAGRLADELARRGMAVTWLASRVTTPPERETIRTAPVAAWNVAERRLGIPFPLLGPSALARLFGEIRRADVVMLHDSLYPISMATALAARLTRTPLVLVQHIGSVPYRNRFLRFLMAAANRLVARPILSSADQAVFISTFVRDAFAGVRFRSPPQIIFNGVDAEVFRPGDAKHARRTYQLPASGPVALFVGRFVEKKGLHLIEQMARLRPDVTFALAGWGVIDPAGWGLGNVQVFSGLSGERLAELYRAADVFILPSCGEGFPLVVQEALASGLPVVCGAETLGADPIAAPLMIGVDVERPDVQETMLDLIAAMDRALRQAGPAERSGRRDLAVSRYGWPAAAERYAEVLDQITHQPRGEKPKPSPSHSMRSAA